jgi:competence protein ComEC
VRRQRSKTTAVLLCLLILSFAGWREFRVRPDGLVHIDVLDVGQGDSIFITGPQGQQVLIDGGPDLSALTGIAEQMSFFDRTIDLLVLTHPDLDHVSAMPEILRRYHVKTVLFTGIAHENAPYRAMLALLKETQTPVLIADPAQDIDLGGGLLLDILWPPPIYAGVDRDDANNTSIIIRVIFGEDSMLLTGDMEEPEEEEVLASGEDIRSDILKVGHHGSKTSSSTGFLLAVDPDLAVITAGRDNRFGHPHRVTLDRLQHFDISVRVTAWEGAIELVMDGKKDGKEN